MKIAWHLRAACCEASGVTAEAQGGDSPRLQQCKEFETVIHRAAIHKSATPHGSTPGVTRSLSSERRHPHGPISLHTVTLSDILGGDDESFQDPPLLALDAQDWVVGFCTLRGRCGDGTGVDRR